MHVRDFELEKTLNCGQVFHWEKHGDGFVGAIGEKAVYVEQLGDELHFVGVTAKVVTNYFSLDHPLAEICRSFPRDPSMRAARDFCQGLRIIRQPLWECLATFICSSMKQVAHIRQISLALRRRFGTKHNAPRGLKARSRRMRRLRYGSTSALRSARDDGATDAPLMTYVTDVYDFPSAERLARSSEEELRGCALGYRAKNLLETARRVAKGEADLDAWRKLPDDELRGRLCELPGVGVKVANCVMLFAYERLKAFPIDVWIERVLREQYFPRRKKVTARQLREFCDAYFGAHGGYAQQYLFHHARKGGAPPKAAESDA